MVSSPLSEDQRSVSSSKKSPATGTKSLKPQHRAHKRSGSAAAAHHHDHITHSTGMDGRHKRVWKACERCRMKKTKCDGEFPCKRCKDDGLVCTAGIRKKVEFKQLPRGYAEVLENTQFALIATVHKLYNMVRNGEQWALGEPEFNERGLPVIHDIAAKLGAIRPNSDIDLPIHSVFPEDEAGMAELARQLEAQMPAQDRSPTSVSSKDIESMTSSSSTPEREQSVEADLDMHYPRPLAFSSSNFATSLSSPASVAHSLDYEPEVNSNFNLFTSAPSSATFAPPMWNEMMAVQQQQQQQLNQFMTPSFGSKPEGLSQMASDPMISMGDPMIYHGFEFNDLMVYQI